MKTDFDGKVAPRLKLKFLSHGTLESKDLARSRRFYEEFLGPSPPQTFGTTIEATHTD